MIYLDFMRQTCREGEGHTKKKQEKREEGFCFVSSPRLVSILIIIIIIIIKYTKKAWAAFFIVQQRDFLLAHGLHVLQSRGETPIF